jgi:hypothetical protein
LKAKGKFWWGTFVFGCGKVDIVTRSSCLRWTVYCLTGLSDSGSWTRPCCYRVHKMARGVCTGLAARLPINTSASHNPTATPKDWANVSGANPTWGSLTRTISTVPPSSVSPGTVHRWQHVLGDLPELL